MMAVKKQFCEKEKKPQQNQTLKPQHICIQGIL